MMLFGLLMAATVGTSAGPDLEDRAVAVDLPVDHVMVFSDRARVTRAGRVKLKNGVVVVRAPDLPGAVMLDTVHVTATGAKVVRVETRPVQRERWSIDQVDQWLADLEKIGDQIALAQGRLQVTRNELALLANLDVAPPVPEKDRLGKPPAPLAPDAWRALQDHLAERRGQARTTERNLERELRDLQRSYDRARREVAKRNVGAFSDRKIEVLVILDGDKPDGELSVEYAVPGAFWKPAYDLAFDPDRNTVELRASGLVTQATGEDWPQAKLALSTAIPGQGIAVPVLETWTVGDDREWMPHPTAKNPPRSERPFQPPPPKPRLEELEKQADASILQARSQQLLAMAESGAPPPVTVDTSRAGAIDFSSADLEGGLLNGPGSGVGYGSTAGRPRPSPPRAAMPPPPPPAPPAAREELDEAPMAAPAGEAATSMSTSAWRGPPAPSGISLALDEPMPEKQRFSDPMLPAVSAGGFDYVYDAPVPVTVPSEADQLRVPLAARRYDVSTFYEATPSLATTAYLKATVKNGSRLPILAGPANVFVKSTFAGDAQLATTGPGGVLELPLGADEDIRLTRSVVPATKSQGFLFGQEDVTDYTVTIDIGNYKKRAVTVRVIDQIPKTNTDKMKVELLSASPKAVEAPNGDGLLYWHVDLPAGGTKKVTFTYRITRPKGWRLR